MDALKKLNEFHKQDDELLLANINHELLSGTFGISRIQKALRIGYNRAAHLVDRSIENGILVRPDEYPHMARFGDEMRKKMDIKMCFVECLECEKEFETSQRKQGDATVTCSHCNYEHGIDTDDLGEGQFWYLCQKNNSWNKAQKVYVQYRN